MLILSPYFKRFYHFTHHFTLRFRCSPESYFQHFLCVKFVLLSWMVCWLPSCEHIVNDAVACIGASTVPFNTCSNELRRGKRHKNIQILVQTSSAEKGGMAELSKLSSKKTTLGGNSGLSVHVGILDIKGFGSCNQQCAEWTWKSRPLWTSSCTRALLEQLCRRGSAPRNFFFSPEICESVVENLNWPQTVPRPQVLSRFPSYIWNQIRLQRNENVCPHKHYDSES